MRGQLVCWTPKAFMTKSYLWGRPPLAELTLELYFSVLYVEAEEPVEPARGERVVDKEEEEERWRAMSLSMSDNPVNPVDLLLLLSPEEKPPA